jgi:hypothetical protein
MANGRCRIHGGKTPNGLALPQTKHLRYSKYLPDKLLSAYQDASSDPELLSLRHDINLIDALLLSNFEALDTEESGEAWKAIRKSVIDMQMAFHKDDYGKCVILLAEMRDIIDRRVLHYATEQEIRDKLEQRRKLVETVHKIDFQKERAITAEQAILLMSAMLDSVRRNVSDSSALSAIQADFVRLVGATHQHQLNGNTNSTE